MSKKLLFLIAAILMIAAPVFGQGYTRKAVQVIDYFGDSVTDITSITILNAGTSDNSTLYGDRNGNIAVTNPITTGSTNTTFTQDTGSLYFYSRDADYKITVTNGSQSLTLDSRTGSDTRVAFYAEYISTAASLSMTDSQTFTLGSDSDWVLQGGNEAGVLTMTPAADNSEVRIGTSGTSLNSDFNVYVGTALGLKLDAGVPSLTWDGGAAAINVSSDFNTTINTGTSTGSVTIGSSTSGAWALDGTSTGTLNADDSIDMTTSGAAADIDIDAAAGSMIIDGGEAVDDAVTITATGAAGGIDITSLGDIDITTTGTAGEDITITNTGGSINITATEAITTALVIDVSTAGAGIDITSGEDIDITTTGAAAEDITITNTGGSVNVSATEDIATAIVINATTGGIDITADGAAGSDLDLVTTNGSTNISGGEAIADAVTIAAGAGGVDISAAATFDIDVTATGGTVQVIASEAAANQFKVDATGTVAGNAIVLETTNGGVQINADGSANGDITVDAASAISITADEPIAVDGAWIPTDTETQVHVANDTLDAAADVGRLHQVSTDAVVLTLPAVGTGQIYKIMNTGADAAVEIHVDTNAADKILGGCGFTALDNGDRLTNTKASADYGDYVIIQYGTADGWFITEMVGTWADGG